MGFFVGGGGTSWGGRGEGGTSAALLLLWEEFLRVFRLPANGPAFVPSDLADLLELKERGDHQVQSLLEAHK